MVGVLSYVVKSHSYPFLCTQKAGHEPFSRPKSVELCSSFSHHPCQRLLRMYKPDTNSRRRKKNNNNKNTSLGILTVVSELGGQYEDAFGDVKTQLVNYFTYKAVRTVLTQLYEMNPQQYRWFYDFVSSNKPGDGKRFLRILAKEKQELAERVMVTRLHLYGKWVKKCDHAQIYQLISEQNLELLRERLLETVIWPSDDTST
ncbi:chaperonin-like RbcX protein 2, chloroplastic [Impatiens glandulifera]|uniref:chaperonin-like RbcX protein 2, chloroplastic n=1 Tax=Impatiens glandulifera TaxID=253017 RepID=UPI001FB0E63C|nr:chaperonin-like RbcX protein 2, chloroplastic [Impatiens glandulifera]